MLSDFQLKRIRRLIQEYIRQFNINLSGLTVLTEVASGYYLFPSILSAIAGAEKIYAITRDSRWGKASDIRDQLQMVAKLWRCDTKIEIITKKTQKIVSQCDIIMNMGFVRPIDRTMISWMKPTAVIPLMWETWEFRPDELDLDACKEKGILVMGTHEDTELNRATNNGYLAWHLIAKHKIEVPESRIFVFSSGYPARGINEVFSKNNVDYRWTTFDKTIPPEYKEYYFSPDNKNDILDYIRHAEVVVCHEHVHPRTVIGRDGIITLEELSEVNPDILFIHISGLIDHDRFKKFGIFLYPDRKVPFGTLTIGTWELGPRSPLQLQAAGLKVGEAMALARKQGMNIRQAKEYAMVHSLAMDFK